MKKLEKKIIEKAYQYETKRTISELFVKLFLLVLSLFSGLIIAQAIITVYIAQQTLDLLQIFSEDIEVIRNYFGDVLQTFYEETPKDLLVLLVIIIIFGFGILLTIFQNFGKIKNRIRSIVAFKRKKL